jgi:Na+/H+-translocating membrane pyrophosphatase
MKDDGSQGYVVIALIAGAIESALAGYIGMYVVFEHSYSKNQHSNTNSIMTET